MEFQENPSNGSRDKAEKLHHTEVNCALFLTDGNIIMFVVCAESARYGVSGKSLQWKPR